MVAHLVKLKLLIIGLCLTVSIFGGFGLLNVDFETDARVYFARESAERSALEDLESRFGRYSTAAFVIVPDTGSALSASVLPVISATVQGLAAVKEVVGYQAITEIPLAGDDKPADQSRKSEYFSADIRALAETIAKSRARFAPLLSADERAAAVISTLKIGPATRNPAQIHTELAALRDRLRSEFPKISFMLTGEAALDAAFNEALVSDLIWLVPAQVVLLVALLIITLGFTVSIALLIVLGIATLTTIGLTGWLDLPLNGVTSAVPTVLLGLAVATCVHLILSWLDALADNADKRAALRHAIAINFKPVTLAIATTIVSFLCLNFSNSPPFQQFGNLVALGLFLTYILAFTLLPLLLLAIPIGTIHKRLDFSSTMARFGAGVMGRRVLILAIFVSVTVASLFGIDRIRFDDTFSHYFSSRFEFRRATDLFEEKLTGITVLNVAIPADGGKSIVDAENLVNIQKLGQWLKDQPHVSNVTSIIDVFSEFGRQRPGILGPDDLPASPMIADGMVRAYQTAKAPMLPVALLDEPLKSTRITVVLAGISSAELVAFAEKANAHMAELWPQSHPRLTGIPLLAAHLSTSNTEAMFAGTLIALAAISIIIAVALGSLRLGLVSLIPNLLPLIAAYGFWGLVFGEVSFAATVVVAMTFGIVVDDTVHIMARYRYKREHDHLDPHNAMIESFRTVGVAVWVTSLAIGSGFAVLAFSGFLVNHHLGLLTVFTLVAALLAALLFLPHLLVLSDPGDTAKPQDKI